MDWRPQASDSEDFDEGIGMVAAHLYPDEQLSVARFLHSSTREQQRGDLVTSSSVFNGPVAETQVATSVLPSVGAVLPLQPMAPTHPARQANCDAPDIGARLARATTTQHCEVADDDCSAWPPDAAVLYGAGDATKIPTCIREAVLGFRPTATCTPLPLPRNHRSITFKYGVRVQCLFRGAIVVGWICMASDTCRREVTFLPFHGGKTTNATKHLWEAHQIQSDKTVLQSTRKRNREEEVTRILASAQCRDDAKRMCLLLETIRIIYNNYLFALASTRSQ